MLDAAVPDFCWEGGFSWKPDANFMEPLDRPRTGFPHGRVSCQIKGPRQPGEGTAGISEMDAPKFQAPVSSSIIYKEHDVVEWNLIHNASLMPL